MGLATSGAVGAFSRRYHMTEGRDRAWWLVLIVSLVLGVVLRAGAFAGVRTADDHYHLAMIERDYPAPRSPFALYDFIQDSPREHRALLDAGIFPWWTQPGMRLAVMRPLSSATLWADHALAGRNLTFAHAHSMLWWCAMLVAASRVFRRLLPRRAAMAATVLLAVDYASVVPTVWVANRNALLAVTFGALAWESLLTWSDTGSRRHLAALVAWVGFGLLAGEYAVAMAGWLGVFALADARGSRRLAALAAVGGPVAVFLVTWAALGYGARGTTTYVDPWHDGVRWLTIAAWRMTVLFRELWFGPVEPTAFTRAIGAWAEPLVGVGLIVCVLRALAGAEPTLRRRLALLIVALPLVVLPTTSAPPQGRLLLAASVGACALVACLVELTRERRWRVLALALLVAHVTLNASRLWSDTWTAARLSHFERAVIPLAGADLCRAPGRTFLMVGAGDFTTAHVQPLLWRTHGCARPGAWRYLSFTDGDVLVVRTGDAELEVRAPRGGVLGWLALAVWRDERHPLRVGDTVRVRGMTATVLEVEAGRPSRIRYRFDRTLDDPSMVLLVGTRRGLEQVRPLPLHGGRLVRAGG